MKAIYIGKNETKFDLLKTVKFKKFVIYKYEISDVKNYFVYYKSDHKWGFYEDDFNKQFVKL
jgi:hypothetical protein